MREDLAIQEAIGRKDIPNPTTAGDFCRRFTLGQLLQMSRALAEAKREVYRWRREREQSIGTLRIPLTPS